MLLHVTFRFTIGKRKDSEHGGLDHFSFILFVFFNNSHNQLDRHLNIGLYSSLYLEVTQNKNLCDEPVHFWVTQDNVIINHCCAIIPYYIAF